MKMIHLPCLLMIIGMTSCEDKSVVRLVERVGEDVILPCSLGPEVDIEQDLFEWMKDGQYMFQYNGGFYHSEDQQFRGRVSHFPDKLNHGDASIIIRNIRLSDSGNYSCIFQRHQHKTFHVELVVATTVMKVKEDDDIILDCSFGATNIENEAFDWHKDVDKNKKEVFFYSQGSYYGHGQTGQDPQFEGRVSHFPDQLRFGNASIKITKAKTSDSGTYTCYNATIQPVIKSTIVLTVDPILKPRPEIEDGASNGWIIPVIVAVVVVVIVGVVGVVVRRFFGLRNSAGGPAPEQGRQNRDVSLSSETGRLNNRDDAD